jgi:hypothetical protein
MLLRITVGAFTLKESDSHKNFGSEKEQENVAGMAGDIRNIKWNKYLTLILLP